jgi:hypothetical protein
MTFASLLFLACGASAWAGGPPPMYVVVDKVVAIPAWKCPNAVEIWGSFTRASGRDYAFSKPVYGYQCFSIDPARRDQCKEEWQKWQSAAGSGKAVALGSCGEAGTFLTAPIREPDVRLKEADAVYSLERIGRFGGLYANGHYDDTPHVRELIRFDRDRRQQAERNRPAPAAASGDKMHRFLTDAVFAGLKEDGVPRELAAELAKNPDYLGKCSICNATLTALRDYAALREAPPGKGLRKGLNERLRSRDDAVRREALRELVQDYTERGYVRKRMSAEEKRAMEATLEAVRKGGMTSLPRGQQFCPSCDGACRARERGTAALPARQQ